MTRALARTGTIPGQGRVKERVENSRRRGHPALRKPGFVVPGPGTDVTGHNPPMARETQTIEVHALGSVTFRPLGKVAMERLQEAARRNAVSPLRDRRQDASPQQIEDALLVSKQVLEPHFSSYEDLLAALDGHDHVIGDIADAIRAASWPNQPAG
jgi:hypothetical protein